MSEYVTIKTSDLVKASSIAAEMRIVLDRTLGGLKETMQVSGRKAGPMGNHERRWNDAEKMVFEMAVNA